MSHTNFYTANGWQGSRYNSLHTTAEVAAQIRAYIREHYKGFKFRVRSENYSGGSTISITLVSGPVPVMRDTATRPYISTTSVGFDIYEKDMTPDGFAMMRDVTAFAVSFNRSDSDGMQDYFDEKFYLRIHVGDFGAPYQVKEIKAKPQAVMSHPVRGFIVKPAESGIPHTAEGEELDELLKMKRSPETIALNATLVVVDGSAMRGLRFVADNGTAFENRGTAVLLHPVHGFVVMPGDEGLPYSPSGGADALNEILQAGGFLSFEGFRFVWPVGHDADTIGRVLAAYGMGEKSQPDGCATDVRCVDYSAKAVAIVGNTRPLADKLKDLGGKFNSRLSCGAGWIFSKRSAERVCAALGVALSL